MKLIQTAGLVFIGQLMFSLSVYAEEDTSFEVFPRAGVGLNWLAYSRLDGTELDAYFTTINVGLSLNYSQFYFDLGGEILGVDNVEKEGQITGVEREDLTGTIGYLPDNNTSVFFGYTVGETKDDFKGEFHEDRGFFFGAGYSLLKNDTSYSFTLAYADLNGSIAVDEKPAENTDGKTSGFSYGFVVSGPFRETMGYSLGLKVRRYDYNVDGTDEVTDKIITSVLLSLVF